MECNMGRRMIPSRGLRTSNGESNNFGNLRKNSQGFKPSGTPPVGYIRVGRGPHAVFDTPADGINAYCWVLKSVYLDQGRTTLQRIIAKYAPSEDPTNHPSDYEKVVQSIMNDAL
jgi:hypothetical protein